jgi:hypothetical protein
MGPNQSQNNQDFNLSLEHPKFLDAKIIKTNSQQKKNDYKRSYKRIIICKLVKIEKSSSKSF